MQIVSIGDNLHEMSNPVFVLKKNKKNISKGLLNFFTQNAKPSFITIFIFINCRFWETNALAKLMTY